MTLFAAAFMAKYHNVLLKSGCRSHSVPQLWQATRNLLWAGRVISQVVLGV